MQTLFRKNQKVLRKMLTKEKIHRLLKPANVSYVSGQTGVSEPTISKLKKSVEGDFSYEAIKKLSDYFESLGVNHGK